MEEVAKLSLDETGRLLTLEFAKSGHECAFIARAPGRVNLIGEHIDYNGYAVLPMALEQAIYLAVGYQTDQGEPILNLFSTTSDFCPVRISCSEADKFGSDGPPEKPEWYNYFLCGYRAIQEYAIRKGLPWQPRGLHVCVGGPEFGRLFIAAGLSSSAAFVVASAIAVVKANKLNIDKRELADLCAKCERYIGMQSGGMDQAASLLGTVGHAMLIEFTKPMVTSYPVPLPRDVVFVIAHSGVFARKVATSHYNERVAECRLAAHMLISAKGTSESDPSKVLCDAQQAWQVADPNDMVKQTGQGSIVSTHIPQGLLKREDLEQNALLKLPIDKFLNANTRGMHQFALQTRAKHVFAEAARVHRFHDLCKRVADPTLLPDQLGELMNDSHESCSRLYECSCPELDELVQVCREGGAVGSRLTGAGWGGCVVSLVRKCDLDGFITYVKQYYYDKRKGNASDDVDSLLFVSKAGQPAGYIDLA